MSYDDKLRQETVYKVLDYCKYLRSKKQECLQITQIETLIKEESPEVFELFLADNPGLKLGF